MRFEVVNGQFGFIGKVKELDKIEKSIEVLLKTIDSLGCIEYDVCEFTDTVEISYEYDTDFYRVEDVKTLWKSVKKSLK